jgi:hypothetical protein
MCLMSDLQRNLFSAGRYRALNMFSLLGAERRCWSKSAVLCLYN